MPGQPEIDRARRYFLGEMTDEEAAAVEQEYFADAVALERLNATEEDLIEDYLGNRLTPAELDQFRRVYLAVPHRRRRVDTIRQLMAAASRGSSAVTSPAIRFRGMAAAAVILAVTALGIFVWRFSFDRSPSSQRAPVEATISPLPSPQTFAVSISPITVRAASGTPNVVIPAGTEVVAISLEGESTARIVSGRASIRAAAGDEVWQGVTVAEGTPPEGVIARLSVPAARLAVDDYVITLFRTSAASTEQEVARYVLRVRAR